MTTETANPAVKSDKTTLCIRSNQDLANLITGKVDRIDTFMVPRSICEVLSDTEPYKQLIPYVNFTGMSDSGKLVFLAYSRPATGSESRLWGDTSIGFGGHMDELGDIIHSGSEVKEAYPGKSFMSYTMNKSDLVTSLYNAARREVHEELGEDLFEKFGITPANINMMVAEDAEPDDVGKVHTCISISVDLPAEGIMQLKDSLPVEKREVHNLRVVGIEMDSICKGDLEQSLQGLKNSLENEVRMERWSLNITMTRVVMSMNFIYANTSFADLFRMAVSNAAAAHQAQVDAANAAAQAAADEGLAKSSVISGDAYQEAHQAIEKASAPDAPAEVEANLAGSTVLSEQPAANEPTQA